ncbi:hypothetical protein MF672_047950 [Actinomadura sp. ATCC 31491]|uniref:Uncharacterized protein n=1 Tax=Actinomadura luzonensis TaxID=2805427 RepID=A0ABT0GBM0_9ACTN|nr:hypothetical protein [Actinomadura luzonensis]MCK2221488.1 hypothetical protein [Actinomadura luzonensis]
MSEPFYWDESAGERADERLAGRKYDYKRRCLEWMRVEAEDVLDDLERRGLPVSYAMRAHVQLSFSPCSLDLWKQKLWRVETAEELFALDRALLDQLVKDARLLLDGPEAELAGGAEGEPDLGESAA